MALRLIEAVAKRAGFNVQKAVTGAEAEAQADLAPIDFIIVDLHLPDSGGFPLIERLRGRVQLADVPFLVCTGDVTMENIVEARRLGALEFMRKPIDLFELQRRLEKCLDTLKDRWIPTGPAGLHTAHQYQQLADTLRETRDGMAAVVALLEGDVPADDATIAEALNTLREQVRHTESPRLVRLVSDLVAMPASAHRSDTLRTALRVAMTSLDQRVAS